MKNRNENTTINQFPNSSFTIFETFFKSFILKVLAIKKDPFYRVNIDRFLAVYCPLKNVGIFQNSV